MILLGVHANFPQVLHPQEKMSYSKEQNWLDDWKKAACKAVIQLWENHYKPKDNEMATTAAAADDIVDERDRFAIKKRRRAVASTGNALEDWLNSPPVDADAAEDPICWRVEDYPKT
ncbi:hypothetical protein V5O48_014393 [Marasmius crinis-equi]|uniref:Uncharacterized protein n=1 Tax=Marasmius crinis-equi TaxID=585013 RepID=A0ABR3EXE5_9AGAR